MSTFTTSIQHYTKRSNQEKEIESTCVKKEEVRLPLFAET
jgi:hypothetical protein